MSAYNVTLRNREDLEQFYLDTALYTCIAQRPLSLNTEFDLSPEEAETLRSDSRVLAVEEIREEINGVDFNFNSSYWYKGNLTGFDSNKRNWALARCSIGSQVSNWGDDGDHNTTHRAITQTNGKNVDIVIMDGAPISAHPEFAVNFNGTGGSRVQEYNWLQNTVAAGVGSSNGTYDYTDSDASKIAHGTALAGVAAGARNGWATKANIFSFDPFGDVTLTGTSGSRRGAMLDLIKYWHNNKTEVNGQNIKNPTVLSFSMFNSHASPKYSNTPNTSVPWCRVSDVVKVLYRGTTHTGPFSEAELLGYKLQPNVKPTMKLRATASVSSGTSSFVAFFTDESAGSGDFLTKSFTSSGTWPYAASNSSMANRVITGISATGSTYTYNGTAFPTYTVTLDAGINTNISAEYGYTFEYGENVLSYINYLDTAATTDITQMIADGIHVVSSAGNQNAYLAALGSSDHGNYIKVVDIYNGNQEGTYYYNRGGWMNQSTDAITVGNIDNDKLERKRPDSNKGPGVDIWAPGTGIVASGTTYYNGAVDHPVNSSYKNFLFYGTSAAAPQVAGCLAMNLTAYPYVTPKQGKGFIVDQATKDQITEQNPPTQAGTRYLDGAANKFLFSGPPIGLDTSIVSRTFSSAATSYANGSTTAHEGGTLVNGEYMDVKLRIYGMGSNVIGDIQSVTIAAGSNCVVENTTLTWTYTDAYSDFIESTAFRIRPTGLGAIGAVATVVIENASGVDKSSIFNIGGTNGAYGLMVTDGEGKVRLDTRHRYTRLFSRVSGSSSAETNQFLSVTGVSTDGTFGCANVYPSSKWSPTVTSNGITLKYIDVDGDGAFFYNSLLEDEYDILIYRQ